MLKSSAPKFYDPFTNRVSFIELNKKRRGEFNHTPEERFHNLGRRPRTISIYIRRNGDHYSKPKKFIWRVWRSNRINDLLEEAGHHLDMDHLPDVIYNSSGRIVRRPDEITDGQTYTFARENETYDHRRLNASDNMSKSPKSDDASVNEDDIYAFTPTILMGPPSPIAGKNLHLFSCTLTFTNSIFVETAH